MRRWAALVRTAAVEVLAEPLSAVLLLSAVVCIHLLPALHVHQMGDVTRFPRACGASAVVVFGLAFILPAAVRTVDRAIRTGTASTALACGVGRGLFFLGRLGGVLLSFVLFAGALFAATLAAVASAQVAAHTGDGSMKAYGPLLACGIGGALLAFAAAAALDRFARRRFVLWASLLTAAASVATAIFGVVRGGLDVPSLTAVLVPAAGCAALAAVACALAVVTPQAGAWTVALAVGSFFLPVKALAPPEGCWWVSVGLSAACLLMASVLGTVLLRRREFA